MLSPQDVLTHGSVDPSTFVILNSKLYLDVAALIGETANSLSAQCIAEMFAKLHLTLYRTQIGYNSTRPQGQRINSWFEPSSGQAQYYSSLTPPGYYATWNYQATFFIPSNIDNVVPVLA